LNNFKEKQIAKEKIQKAKNIFPVFGFLQLSMILKFPM